jgi:hypothetical protein
VSGTAGSVVGDRNGGAAWSRLAGSKSHHDRAVHSRRQARTACLALAEISAGRATPLISSGELPLLVRVAACVVLAVPASCGLKLKPAAGEKFRVSGSGPMKTVIGVSGRLVRGIRDFDGECHSLRRCVWRALARSWSRQCGT